MVIARKVTALIAALALGSSSCATLIYGGGAQQTVSISTDPSGATVQVDRHQVVSPAQIVLERYTNHEVVATKPGYQMATATIVSDYSWATVVDMIFILPWVIDMVCNGIYTLSPDTVNLVLTPASIAQASPPK
jgi:hypothetical protein